MKTLLTLIIALALAGCATVSQQEVANAHFAPLPANYQAAIRGYMATQLKDPYSAVYEFGTPRRGFFQDGLIHGGGKHFGYIVPTTINARNSFGGYTGAQLYYIALYEGRVSNVSSIWGQMAGFID